MESELRAGETVELTIEAKVACRYNSGRVKIRWLGGEETFLPSDTRVNPNG